MIKPVTSVFNRIFPLILLALGACVHQPDIQQGNVITEEAVNSLTIGMKPNQVRSIVGTPMIIDPFRSERWEYVYSMTSRDRNESQFSYVTLYFDKGVLSDIKIHQQPLKEDEIRSIEMSARKRF